MKSIQNTIGATLIVGIAVVAIASPTQAQESSEMIDIYNTSTIPVEEIITDNLNGLEGLSTTNPGDGSVWSPDGCNTCYGDVCTTMECVDFEDELDIDINLDFNWDKIDEVISETDWETLSSKQIDEKLIENGMQIIGDLNDPLYEYTQEQWENLTDSQWDELEKEFEEFFQELGIEDFDELGMNIFDNIDWDKIDEVITESDWETLSPKQIDEKLIKNGLETIGDSKDPLYEYTEAQLEALTDAQWDVLNKEFDEFFKSLGLEGFEGSVEFDDADFLFGEDDLDWDKIDEVITESDWEILSQKQIDEKLVANGLETIGDSKDPLYNYTFSDLESLTDAQWNELDKEFEKYFESFVE